MNRRGTRAVRALAVTIVLAGGAAACGGPSSNGEAAKSPSQILRDAQAATASASSVRVSGSGTFGGKPISLDIVSSAAGGGGTMTVNGAELDVVAGKGNVYLKASSSSWTALGAPASAGSILAGKWWSAPASNSNFAQLARLLSVAALVRQLEPTGTITKGGTTTVDGQSVIPLRDSTGATLYVDATGKPYIQSISAPRNQPGQIRFSQYGTARPPAIPKGATSLSALGGG